MPENPAADSNLDSQNNKISKVHMETLAQQHFLSTPSGRLSSQ